MSARSEPLLWVQLIGGGLLPLEALLLLLLLAGSDPGPVPALERLLCWALGGLAPTLLLWKRPADVWSLLLLQTPLRARRPLQQRLSRLQESLLPRLGLVLGGALGLPLLWWLDEHAGAAGASALLAGSPRLVLLLLTALVLSVMLWQWQQLVQALWLLSRSPESVAGARPMAAAELEESRLCLGLPLLLLEPLELAEAAPAVTRANPPSPASPGAPAWAGDDSPVAGLPQESDGLDQGPPPTAEPVAAPEPAASAFASPVPAEHPAGAETMAGAGSQPAADPPSLSSVGEGEEESPAGVEWPASAPPPATAFSPLAQELREGQHGTPSQPEGATETDAAAPEPVDMPCRSGLPGQDPEPLQQPADPALLDSHLGDQAVHAAETPQPVDLAQHPQALEVDPSEASQALQSSAPSENS